jgi:putative DNA primase/helicase
MQGDLVDVPTITAGERRLLLWCARSFDELPAKRVGGSVSRSGGSGPIGDRPGDHYNQRGRWADLLKPRGWRYLFTSGRTQYWQRPGKDRGWSATVNHMGTNRLHVFSTSCAPLEADTSYSLFGAYTLLEHGGDFTVATRVLAAQGYGKPREKKAAAQSGVRVYGAGARHRGAARRRGSVIVTGRGRSRDGAVRV